MRVVGGSIYRARLVQRAQSVRQRRIGGLLVSVRFEQRDIQKTRTGFQAVLSSIGAFQRMPVSTGHEILDRRLAEVAVTAEEALKGINNRDEQLSIREARLQRLLTVAERAVQRGVDREWAAAHEADRVRESVEVAESQSQETEGTDEPLRASLVASTPLIAAVSESFGAERQNGPYARQEAGWVAISPNPPPRIVSTAGDDRRLQTPVARGHHPNHTHATMAVRQVVVEAALPQSAGSVEIVHVPEQGVSVRVSARGSGVAAVVRRSCRGIRDSLQREGVRVSAIDVVQDE